MPDDQKPIKEYADKPTEELVRVGGTTYRLREMDSPALAGWMKYVALHLKKDKKGNATEETDFRQFHATLIAKNLYDETGQKLVPRATIDSWPSSTLNGLFEDCQRLNGLDDEGKVRTKKASETESVDGSA